MRNSIQPLTLEIMPSFFCNGRCDFCYLGPAVKDRTTLLIDDARAVLERYRPSRIDLFGGELSILPQSYVRDLVSLCLQYTNDVSLTTNLAQSWILEFSDRLSINVSIGSNRDPNVIRRTAQNLKNAESRKLTALVVITPSMLNFDFSEVERLGFGSVAFLPYSPSVHASASYRVANKDFEQFMIRAYSYFQHSKTKLLINRGDPTARSTLFVLPNGKPAVLAFDDQGREYFLPVTDNEYAVFCDHELKSNPRCLRCSHFHDCGAEHLRPYDDNDSCPGFFKFLEFLTCH